MRSKANQEVIVVGDKVLIKPEAESNKTPTGLYLPEGVTQKEKVQGGYVVKVGPGYPIPDIADDEEPWTSRSSEGELQYIGLQAKEGDYAVFLRKAAIEIELDGETYLIISHSSILLLMRDSGLLE